MNESVVLVAERNGLVLATSRKDNHQDFGLPGGKMDPGETPIQALKREIKEETGLALKNPRFIATELHNGIPVHLFSSEVTGIEHTTENLVIKWVPWSTVFAGSFGIFNKMFYDKYMK